MRQSKLYHRTIAAFAGSLTMVVATNASAAGFAMNGDAGSSSFNQAWGSTSSSSMNAGADPSIRDANGNLTIVNGLIGPANLTQQTGVGSTSAGATTGTGTNGNATATAIGNNLSVQVQGNWNTTIVNSTQTNTGNQNANASLNGQLKL
jgi:holdfast attachment protein HfaA